MTRDQLAEYARLLERSLHEQLDENERLEARVVRLEQRYAGVKLRAKYYQVDNWRLRQRLTQLWQPRWPRYWPTEQARVSQSNGNTP